jgi:aminoglycoside phosphotransferase (APT) family kinase protein
MTPSRKDIAVVSEIATAFLQGPARSVRLIGQGSNNKNFLIETAASRVVVKLSHEHKRHRAKKDYQKEKWCIEQSSALGVPGPSVLSVGEAGDSAYMIQTFVDGVNGKEIKGDRTAIWRKLGEYAKLIHLIDVSGWGEDFFDDTPGGQRASWLKFLNYNIESLTGDDRLIDLGVIERAQSQWVRRLFEELKDKAFRFGLTHGDLSIWNVLVEPSGRVNLLDWGSAEAHIVPHFDMLHIVGHHLKDGTPTVEEMSAFRQGYGLSDEEHHRLKPELDRLCLLTSFDKLRWAIDRSPSRIGDLADRAKTALRLAPP